MKVKMTSQISGLRDGEEWPAPGEFIDLPEDEANLVVNGGHAVVEDEPEPEKPKAVKPEPETATAKSDAETR